MPNMNKHSMGSRKHLNSVLDRYGMAFDPGGRDRYFDGIVTVPTTDGPRDLPLVMSMLTNFDLAPGDLTLLQKTHPDGILVVERRLTPTQAREYRQRGIPHLDLDGNGWIDLPGFKLWVEGRGSRRELEATSVSGPATPSNRAFTPSGARLVFTLLSRPDLRAAPMRELSHLSGISLGATAEAIQALADNGHLLAGDPERQLIAVPELVAKWIESFRTRLMPSLKTLTFTGAKVDEVVDHVVNGPGTEMVAGEAATDVIRRAETVTLYTKWPPTHLVRALKLTRSSDAPNIILREKFWHEDLFDTPFAPAVLTAAELIASGDPRQREAAQEQLRRVELA